jgi:hypothetical protein
MKRADQDPRLDQANKIAELEKRIEKLERICARLSG